MLNMLNIIDTSEILKAVSNVIQLYARGELYPRGIRTVCGEASYFGMYAAFVLPWILSKRAYAAFSLFFSALFRARMVQSPLRFMWL